MLCFSIWQDQPDSYDKLVKEMALEMRARPSDRTKTPEEIAQEERERLEHLEVWLHACSKLVICLYRCICMMLIAYGVSVLRFVVCQPL